MLQLKKNKTLEPLLIGSIFLAYFIYFSIVNRYHILYLEQNQLFLYNFNYLREHFSLPGALPLYLGRFFTQFFISSCAGALILTLHAFTIFLITDYIYKKHNFRSTLLSIIPVWLLAILQSNQLFNFEQSMGVLFLISFFAIYISANKTVTRNIFYFAGWPILYLFTGGFAIPLVLMCALHELLFRKQKYSLLIFVSYILTGVTAPYLSAQLLFYIAFDKVFTYPIYFDLQSWYLLAFNLLLCWFPLLLTTVFFLKKTNLAFFRSSKWHFAKIPSILFLIAIMLIGVFKYGYNSREEIMLGIDHHSQQSEWDKVLKLADRYPGYNKLVIYFTNIALYKTGQMFDKMFSYPQIGSDGLRLKWDLKSSSFFGGEVFYHLSYSSEAFRWAFEAMVSRGLNPRSLKRLCLTSIVNGNINVARKYLLKLDQTLFYRTWSTYYGSCLATTPVINDPEIVRHRDLIIHSDFISDHNSLNIDDLLNNHPDNKMAYEYLLASLLLDKNLEGFIRVIPGFKDLGYMKLPVHIEEALLFCNISQNKNIIPEGFSIKPETINSFRDYLKISYKNTKNTKNELGKKYGNTYWYYLQYYNK